MLETIKYHNGVTEELKIVIPEVDINKTKEDLYNMKMTIKLKKGGFTEEDLEELNTKYLNKIAPIVSAMDYENISNDEVVNMIDEIDGMHEIDKKLIDILIFGYYKNLE